MRLETFRKSCLLVTRHGFIPDGSNYQYITVVPPEYLQETSTKVTLHNRYPDVDNRAIGDIKTPVEYVCPRCILFIEGECRPKVVNATRKGGVWGIIKTSEVVINTGIKLKE